MDYSQQFAAPYYELADKGVEIDIATPLEYTTRSKSDDPSAATEDTKRLDKLRGCS
jgi:hypothetical protein